MTKKTVILTVSVVFLLIGVGGFLATIFLAPSPKENKTVPTEQVKEMMRQTFEKNKELEAENEKLHSRHIDMLQQMKEKDQEIAELQQQHRDQIATLKSFTKDQKKEAVLKSQIEATRLRLEEIEYGTQGMIKVLEQEAESHDEEAKHREKVDQELEELGETLLIDELPIEELAEKTLQATKELAQLVDDVESVENKLKEKITGQSFDIERLDVENTELAVLLESTKDEMASQQLLLEESLALIDRLEDEKRTLEQEFHERPLTELLTENTPDPVVEEETTEEVFEEPMVSAEPEDVALAEPVMEATPDPLPLPELDIPDFLEPEQVDDELEELDEIIEVAEDEEPETPKKYKKLVKENKKLKKKLEKLKQKVRKDRIAFYYNLGLAYTYAGLYPEAIKMYHKVLDLDPKDAPTHYNLGILYEDHMNKAEKGLEHYQMYVNYSKDNEKRRKVMTWMDIATKKYGSGRQTRRESSEQALKRLFFTNTR